MMMLALLALMMLIFPGVTVDTAADACRLFALNVLPALFPYMTVSSMILSRLKSPLPAGAILLMGWGGGSPAGAKLIAASDGLSAPNKRRLFVACATLSPMFFLGTLSGWLSSSAAGWIVLFSVLGGGCLAGCFAGKDAISLETQKENHRALSLREAVESSARTMLLVCGMTVFFRVCAALLISLFPGGKGVILPALEVTFALKDVCSAPLPLVWKTALSGGIAGFGGCSLMMQNRALCPVMPLSRQIFCQALHGVFSFLLALGAAVLLGV